MLMAMIMTEGREARSVRLGRWHAVGVLLAPTVQVSQRVCQLPGGLGGACQRKEQDCEGTKDGRAGHSRNCTSD
jgi:hypothetical protein